MHGWWRKQYGGCTQNCSHQPHHGQLSTELAIYVNPFKYMWHNTYLFDHNDVLIMLQKKKHTLEQNKWKMLRVRIVYKDVFVRRLIEQWNIEYVEGLTPKLKKRSGRKAIETWKESWIPLHKKYALLLHKMCAPCFIESWMEYRNIYILLYVCCCCISVITFYCTASLVAELHWYQFALKVLGCSSWKLWLCEIIA